MKTREFGKSRDDEMIGDALGTLQGKIDKGTLTKGNCTSLNYYGNLTEPKLPALQGNQWYAKIDVTGMPSYKQQEGRGTPRVVLLVDDATATNTAYFSTHYISFMELAEGFVKKAVNYRSIYSK